MPTATADLYNNLYAAYDHYPYQYYTTGLSPHAHAVHSSHLSHGLDDVFFTTNILTPSVSPHAYHTQTLSAANPSVGPSIKFKPPIVVGNQFKPIIIPRPSTVDIEDAIEPYYHDGRVLKQYLVMENTFEDNTLNGYLGGLAPFLTASYSALPPPPDRPNHGFSVATAVSNAAVFAQQARPTQSTPGIPTGVPQNPTTPLQLGSGSLGYLRLANGAVYLGSGSLGYTNDRQRAEQLQNVRDRQSPQPGPLTFGKSP